MSDEVHLQARHYRRGTILGLTLAELLMLLLFLFLLIMTFVINEREDRIERIEAERLAWREQIPLVTGVSIPAEPAAILRPEDLDRPIEDLRALREERDDLREMIGDAESVDALRELAAAYSELSSLAEATGSESITELLEGYRGLLERANQIRPGQRPQITLEEGLEELGSGLEACIWMPFAPGADTKRVAYSFTVTLVPEGVMISEGDAEAIAEAWTGPLPNFEPGTVITVDEFNRASRRYYEVGDRGAPVSGTSARRPCRFYVRLQRSRRIEDVDVYEDLLQRVQQNFFRSYQIEIVD
jgi:hypothetical protein